MSRSQIAEFAAHFGLEIVGGASLFEVIWQVCSQVLQLPESELLDIMHARVAQPPGESAEASEALL